MNLNFSQFLAHQNFAKTKSRSPRGFLPRPLLRAGEFLTPPPLPQKNSGGGPPSFFLKKIRANDTITSQNLAALPLCVLSHQELGGALGLVHQLLDHALHAHTL